MPTESVKSSGKRPPSLGRLACRGLRFRCLKLTGAAARPQALSLELTRRCIARCLMCNIWQTPRDLPELSAGEWLEVFASPMLGDLRELDVTGGEPFLRRDLVEIFEGICCLKPDRFPRLSSIAVTTNGFLTDLILTDVKALLPALERQGIGLVFAFGLDAVGPLHDRIRGFPGGWEKLEATIRGLAALREDHPGLVLGAKTTVTRHNAGELEEIARFADRHRMFTIVSPYILTPARYANLDLGETLSLSPEDREALRRFYQSPRFRWSYYRRELLHYLEEGRMKKPCTAGFNYYFLRSNGDLSPCPLREEVVGNVRTMPLETLMSSHRAARFRRGVGRFPECAACTEPGLARYALPFEGFYYLRLFFQLGPKDFRELHGHLGLDKYFS
ncbi:radical SAM/SPASM domain-containing protein [Desulfuromonas sp. TF]|uniref:radical SAM protein n=1 Tax=Desulfuromonas sp. TF TaxID=1232410 RepID=UPI00040FCA29|nr:radical SAM/SPASM domain-containing protein [Desulfuromonas sp. TF]